ncbi:MAG TPA: hypothetical protein VHB79_38380 [Polyangiaceae bacterium]|nr:hypothetical protein [Polyangiaceae bacterium]
MSKRWADIYERLRAACTEAGLDLSQPFGVQRLADAPEDEHLHDFGRANALGVLIGNTRALWPRLTEAFATDPALQRASHPLDTYVADRVARAVADATKVASQVVLSHLIEPRAYPIQRLAQRIGFAAISPCHLAVHPEHGMWLGLRAVVTFDCDGPDAPLAPPPRPCDGCAAPCVPALKQALAVTPLPLSQLTIREHADAWIEVRRVCPVGEASRYGEAQLRYHYIHDRTLLRSE